MRALAVFAKFAQHTRNQQIKVPMMPFIKMLNSLVFTDRNKSSLALFQLTEKRDARVLSSLRRYALQSLVRNGALEELGTCTVAVLHSRTGRQSFEGRNSESVGEQRTRIID